MDLKKQIKDIVEADIQIALNDYIEKEGAQAVSYTHLTLPTILRV